LKHVDVARGIAEAQQKHAEKCEITLDVLTAMTLDAYRPAMADRSAKGADAAVKAVAQLSRMHGFEVGKRSNDLTGRRTRRRAAHSRGSARACPC
jgi:hypothetical protein